MSENNIKPIIVFQVDLDVPMDVPGPYTKAEGEHIKYTRSTFIAGLSSQDNEALKHGDTFTLMGAEALYMKARVNDLPIFVVSEDF